MNIQIKNTKDTPHTICTVESGTRLVIPPKSYIEIDTDDDREVGYWSCLKPSYLARIGLAISIDGIPTATETVTETYSVVPNPVIEVDPVTTDTEINTKQSDELEHEAGYSRDELSQMEREDLFNICDNFNIKYKKNNSKNTLIDLILNSGMV